MKIRVSAIILFLLALWLYSAGTTGPVNAQISPTVTPYPRAVMTATAAADRMLKAQQGKAQAAQLQLKADADKQRADAEFDAAQQDANNAKGLLLAQQMQAAGEAIGRADANIVNGRAAMDRQTGAIAEMRAIVDGQAQTISQVTNELQICRADNQIKQAAYTATVEKLQAAEGKLVIDPILALFVGVVFFALLFGLVVMKWQRVTVVSSVTPPSPANAAPADDDVIDGDVA